MIDAEKDEKRDRGKMYFSGCAGSTEYLISTVVKCNRVDNIDAAGKKPIMATLVCDTKIYFWKSFFEANHKTVFYKKNCLDYPFDSIVLADHDDNQFPNFARAFTTNLSRNQIATVTWFGLDQELVNVKQKTVFKLFFKFQAKFILDNSSTIVLYYMENRKEKKCIAILDEDDYSLWLQEFPEARVYHSDEAYENMTHLNFGDVEVLLTNNTRCLDLLFENFMALRVQPLVIVCETFKSYAIGKMMFTPISYNYRNRKMGKMQIVEKMSSDCAETFIVEL